MRLFIIAIVFVLLMSGCGSGTVATNALSASGAWALYPMMVKWSAEYSETHPGVAFDVSAGGAGKGMSDALTGIVDIGMVSRAVKQDEIDQGAFWIPVTTDAVFPVIAARNPVLLDLMKQGISRNEFIGIYITGEITTWGQLVGKPGITDSIHAYTRSDAAGAPEVWAEYLGAKQEDLLGVGVYGDPGLMDAVCRDDLGIGYNNLGYAFDPTTGGYIASSVVVPIDINDNGVADENELYLTHTEAAAAVASGVYPSPPARALNLVTNGKPDGVAADFIKWILTDGQQFVEENGYIPLPTNVLEEALRKLE